MRKRICSTLPDFTLQQIEDLKKFYEREEVLGDKFSTSRILIICVNYFWKHIYKEPDEFTK